MKISNQIHFIKRQKNVLSDDNLFIIEGKKLVVIGSSIKETFLTDYLNGIGKQLEQVSSILLTHLHKETNELQKIKEKSECKIYAHGDINIKKKDIIDIYVKEGDILDVDEKIKIKVIHTPVSTKGSVSYLFQQENALFCGDSIPNNKNFPIYYNWIETLHVLEKIENLPYPQVLLSSKDDPKWHNEVSNTISNGFDIIYRIHEVLNEYIKGIDKDITIERIRTILRKLDYPYEEIEPLFMHTIKSHLNR